MDYSELKLKPESPGKYLAALTVSANNGEAVMLETNDFNRVKRSFDIWRKIKMGGECKNE